MDTCMAPSSLIIMCQSGSTSRPYHRRVDWLDKPVYSRGGAWNPCQAPPAGDHKGPTTHPNRSRPYEIPLAPSQVVGLRLMRIGRGLLLLCSVSEAEQPG